MARRLLYTSTHLHGGGPMTSTKTTQKPLSVSDVAQLAVGLVASMAVAAAIGLNSLVPGREFPRHA